jgi:hypothetical protein
MNDSKFSYFAKCTFLKTLYDEESRQDLRSYISIGSLIIFPFLKKSIVFVNETLFL